MDGGEDLPHSVRQRFNEASILVGATYVDCYNTIREQARLQLTEELDSRQVVGNVWGAICINSNQAVGAVQATQAVATIFCISRERRYVVKSKELSSYVDNLAINLQPIYSISP